MSAAPEASSPRVPVLLITGPCGVGKTSVAHEIARNLRRRGTPNAILDIDALSYSFPVPHDDRFHHRLGMRNLAAVWRNDYDAGARCLILARVLETRVALEDYRAAVPGAEITVVRLAAPLDVLIERLKRRGDERMVDRARELLPLMEQERVEDLLIDATTTPPGTIAEQILILLTWPPDGLLVEGNQASPRN